MWYVRAYAPTNSETRQGDITNKNEFYEQLDDLVSNLPIHDVLIVIGDMNAQVGNDVRTRKPVLGKHAEGTPNTVV